MLGWRSGGSPVALPTDPQPGIIVRSRRSPLQLALVPLLCLMASGCATLGQLAALRHVDFSLDRLSDVRLAGIDLGSIRSFEQLGFADVTRLTLAVASGDLPMDFRVHLRAENPPDNETDARLVSMDWTLFLQDRETLSGVLEDDFVLPPGEPRDIPIPVQLNLMQFFEGGAEDLVQLALAAAGQSSDRVEVALRATPVIDTPLGPIRYPAPITIVERSVGGQAR